MAVNDTFPDLDDLFKQYEERVKAEFKTLPDIVPAASGFDPWTSPIEARRWLDIDDVVAVVCDLRGSTRLSLSMKYRAATAARTLAEGVETAGEMDHLRHEHVNEAQGFLLSRPLDPVTLETRLLKPSRPTPEVTKQT